MTTASALQRLCALRARLLQLEADAFFSVTPPDNQYLTGFMGSTSAVMVTPNDALFLCDFRYTEQANAEVACYTIQEVDGALLGALGERLNQSGATHVVYDPACLTVAQLTAVQEAFRGRMTPVADLVLLLRTVKSTDEIKAIRAASELAEEVLADLTEDFHIGITERELAAEFEYEFRSRGADGAAFETIALFGPRSSQPHGKPGDKPLEPGDIVLLDLGCRMNGYCSDLTRTYVFGRMPETWFRDIYDLVLHAQRSALEAVRPGARCREVDAVARDIITLAGHGTHFGHGLGHGVGIEVHEGPRLRRDSNVLLEEGMIVTVEPGIYLPGQGGVRIEDLVVVTKNGCECISRTPNELRVLSG